MSLGVHLADGTQAVNFGGLSIWDDFPDETKNPCGHSIAVVGYCAATSIIPSGGYFIFRNSYGELWGDSGYGYLSFNFARKYVYDAAIYDRDPEFLPGVRVRPTLVTDVKKAYKIPMPPPTLTQIDKLGKLIHPGSRLTVRAA